MTSIIHHPIHKAPALTQRIPGAAAFLLERAQHNRTVTFTQRRCPVKDLRARTVSLHRQDSLITRSLGVRQRAILLLAAATMQLSVLLGVGVDVVAVVDAEEEEVEADEAAQALPINRQQQARRHCSKSMHKHHHQNGENISGCLSKVLATGISLANIPTLQSKQHDKLRQITYSIPHHHRTACRTHLDTSTNSLQRRSLPMPRPMQWEWT